MPKTKETFHLMHMSSQFTDRTSKMVDDLQAAFDREPDVITFTEFRDPDRISRMVQVARNKGYRPIIGPGDCQLAVRTRPVLKVKSKHSIPVHPGTDEYGAKHLAWVEVSFHGQDIYVSASHWAIRAQDGGIYAQHFHKMARAVCDRMVIHSRKGLAFWAGDINADPDERKYPSQMFREHKVQTCWDDARVEPGTRGGRTIDVIARYRPQQKADFKRYKVWKGYHTDHRPISVWYDITVEKKNNNGGNNNSGNHGGNQNGGGNQSGGGGGTQPDENFLTGGTRSWKDYKDREIYDLPAAIDDSDLVNG